MENHGTIYGATWSDDVMQPPYNGPEWFVSMDGSDDSNGLKNILSEVFNVRLMPQMITI